LVSIVLILALDGVSDGAVGITLDVLGAAERIDALGLLPGRRRGRALEARVVSLDGRDVRTMSGRKLTVDGKATLRGRSRDDILVVPGLGLDIPSEIDAALESDEVARALDFIRRAVALGLTVAASCSATYLLAAAGSSTAAPQRRHGGWRATSLGDSRRSTSRSIRWS